jgi:23S rRNA (cytidine2498-2'-O)-methyltransferase
LARALVAYCRAGFEPETAADLRRAAARADHEVDVAPGDAHVVATFNGDVAWQRSLEAAPPIFARSVFVGAGPFALLHGGRRRADRVTPLLAAIADTARPPWRGVWIEYPDSNEGKQLSGLSRALSACVEREIRASLVDAASKRLHVFLPDGATAWIGESAARDNDWPMGIARLRMPPGAPSRSTLKLAEAFDVFLAGRERELLRPGMRAVDLGAAPGGWTWQLVQRGIAVTAVDNGPIDRRLVEDRLVTHVRDDAFRWRPRRPVDWLVCDVVEQPIRVAELVARWIADGDATHAIFNLKLPMKKRYDEVRRCMGRIAEIVSGRHVLAVRQLYHDREEVTGYLARV